MTDLRSIDGGGDDFLPLELDLQAHDEGGWPAALAGLLWLIFWTILAVAPAFVIAAWRWLV